jgi:glycosyltransferase involved in cell wall biosynthesis
MRIGMISASRVPSRAANSIEVMKVAQSFLDNGHEIRLWLPQSDAQIPLDELKAWYGLHRSVPIEWVPAALLWRKYDFAWNAVRRARKWQAELIYCWPLQAAALSCMLGMPTALEVHDRPQGLFGPRLMRYILKNEHARRILPITAAMREWLEKQYRLELQPPRCLVAPMGVDLEPYATLPAPEVARDRLGLEPRWTVGYTGHLYPGRGLDLMVELAQRNPKIPFLWVGGEPEAVGAWQRRLQSDGVQNVKLVGFIPNVELPLYQAACEVLLMPYEASIAGSSGGDTASFASPMKVFEYLATGRAIMASDLPVLREVLDEGLSLLLPVGDVQAWDQALKRLVAEPDLCQELGQAARERARGYGWNERAGRILSGLAND